MLGDRGVQGTDAQAWGTPGLKKKIKDEYLFAIPTLSWFCPI